MARNQVKRWLREAIRKHQGEMKRSFDMVFIANPKAATAGLRTLEAEISETFSRLSEERS